jgi:hypothetical protein
MSIGLAVIGCGIIGRVRAMLAGSTRGCPVELGVPLPVSPEDLQ